MIRTYAKSDCVDNVKEKEEESMLFIIFMFLAVYGFIQERKEYKRRKDVYPNGYPL